MRRALFIAGLLAATAAGARAEDPPRTLAMRAAEPASTPPAGTAAAPAPGVPPRPLVVRIDPAPRPRDQQAAFEGSRFRFDVGFGLDGGQIKCDVDGNCNEPPSGIDADGFDRYYYDQLRIYGYGDAVIATRGLVARSLSSYFATSFRVDQPDLRATAVPSVYDTCHVGATACPMVQDILVRSGWAETDGTLLHRALGGLRLRAGRQFRYGPAIAHFDGITFAYDSPAVSADLFSGTRVSAWGFDSDLVAEQGVIAGGNATLDMYRLKKVPLVLSGGMLRFDGDLHFEGSLAIQWSPDVYLRGSVRLFDGQMASQRAEIRVRVSNVTTVRAEVQNHAAREWHYDLLLTKRGSQYDLTDPRRWLDFGVRRPRMYASVRAGTVLLSNIDLLLRGGGGFERRSLADSTEADAASYLEGGAAAEVRFRRAVSLGLSALARTYGRRAVEPGDLVIGQPDALPGAYRNIGETSMLEGGLTSRFETGRRSLSATAELYGRLESFQTPYVDVDGESELRGGARFGVDMWIGERLRMRVEYDVTTAIDSAPELRSLKSLRALAEGTL